MSIAIQGLTVDCDVILFINTFGTFSCGLAVVVCQSAVDSICHKQLFAGLNLQS